MKSRMSNKTKKRLKWGEGEGKYYHPWIITSELNSSGTTSIIKDWKTGRQVHCLSQGEALWYYILRWDDNNVEIREQFPLNTEDTVYIAKANGFKHPHSDTYVMTTDFLVTEADGSLHAYSVKADSNLNKRTLEILCIEKIYWMNKGCKFTILLKTNVNTILANNIRKVVEFYDPLLVFDKYSAIKHKIAIKEYKVDISQQPITNEMLDRIFEVVQ